MQSPSRPAPDPSADAAWRAILDAASDGYRGVDSHALRFARAKLGNDRVFRHMLERGLIPAGAHVVDAGCGQGLVASLLRAADALARTGRWPATWATAPQGVRVTGIDLLELNLARARAALGETATFVHADMRGYDFPPCDRVAFLDTLHYIASAEQDAVLAKARAALRPGGALILRVHDASAAARFRFGLWVDRVTMLLHGGGFGRLAGRSPSGWQATLESLGLEVETAAMNGRPPFANLIIVARLPAANGSRGDAAAGLAQSRLD